ncbi:hypothetical protein MRB53_002200 [Persea americana]|uniref:Uncharacterized protein n=1 Tax=Persea americana TaxID=3435 RepID=A0ACC2MTU1_PERAE|nr:hypothetical protein MRB53_002200 [Persea americana]
MATSKSSFSYTDSPDALDLNSFLKSNVNRGEGSGGKSLPKQVSPVNFVILLFFSLSVDMARFMFMGMVRLNYTASHTDLCYSHLYNEILGKGASKIVYRAFDEYEGIEVAWNQE